MNALHFEDQVSLEPSFDQVEAYMLHVAGDSSVLIYHQTASGMEPGEFSRRKKHAWNNLNVQRNLITSFDLASMAFRPSDSVLKSIISVYRSNSVCSVLENRIRLDEKPALRLPVDCSLEIDLSAQDTPIFTKHPHTGEITRHLYPYATLPRFTLPLTDPGLLGIAAYTFDRGTSNYRAPCPLDIVQRFRELWSTDEIMAHCKVFHNQLPTPPSSPPQSSHGKSLISHKRKYIGDDQANPPKRIRIAATASRRIRPTCQRHRRADPKHAAVPSSPDVDIASDVATLVVVEPSSPLKRKRAASQVQDCPVQQAPTRKRPRKDLPTTTIPTRTTYERAAKGKGRFTST
ncbi:hypothetical protein CYLTODRAFT_489437 [Cylindrobasidium torrendii FP15055 ss-10]|uniref:Uncharacterized protein n=1 Tax=Cylindrobasidium torrendii FP15055 ss-10 TaxID=1314674 RepID=A0A0D7BGN6_9AGAR|nr:hypothetical protein CYLTODRAFT_489437 [Cylindrobasidium torrendii FP15055 ss-10]